MANDENGSMIALFAVAAFALLLVAAFVVDVGNWQEHRRHLQVQVDNGATATGGFFTGCFLNPTEANANITREARKFAGDPNFADTYNNDGDDDATTPYGPAYNLQVDDPDRVVLNINRPNWPPPGTDYDPGYDLDPKTDGVQNTPCESKTVLIRAKDVDVPTFFGGVVPGPAQLVDVRAKARVEIRKVVKFKGFLPWGVPEFAPKHVYALFVNEAAGANPTPSNILTLERQDADPLDGDVPPDFDNFTRNGESVSLWTTPGTGGIVDVVPRTGAIIMTTRLDSPSLTGTLSQLCGQLQTQCYSGNTGTSGVGFIHGYPSAGTGSAGSPILREAEMAGPACTADGDSTPYFVLKGDCDVSFRAKIDFGPDPRPLDPGNQPPDDVPDGVEAKVWLHGPGCGNQNQGCRLEFVPDSSGWTGWWETQLPNRIPHLPLSGSNNDGRQDYTVKWETASATATFTDVHHPYVADIASGPISYFEVSPNASFVTQANSLPTGPRTVHLAVGVAPPLKAAKPGEPPILLRFGSGTGSLNQMLDCDKSPLGPVEEIRDGCQTFYAKNERGESCGPPPPTWEPSKLPPPAFENNPTPDCIEANPGQVTALAKGLQQRFVDPPPVGRDCPANQWQDFRSAGTLPPFTDGRWVTLVVTDIAQFDDSGIKVVPVRYQAGFYVTGWFKSSQSDICPDNDLPPPPKCSTWPNDNGSPGCDPGSHQNEGDIWGYFVTTVIPQPGATPDEELCAFNELGTCIAVLTE